jgi:large conductance mechanosensitive channel
VDLAIAIVVGTAFTAVVKAFVADIITPLIAAIYGGEAFTDLYFTVHNSRFLVGDFINNVSHLISLPLVNLDVLAYCKTLCKV